MDNPRPTGDLMRVLEEYDEAVALFVGMRSKLVNHGFTEQQAGDLVALSVKQMFDTAAKKQNT